MSTAPVLSSTVPSSSTRTMAPEASRPLMCAESATPRPRRRRWPAARRATGRTRRAASPIRAPTMSRHSRQAVRRGSAGRRTRGRRGTSMLRRRSAIGSMPSRAAISSSCALGGEGHLRHAEAAEGAEAQLVGVGDPAVRVHVRNAVRAAVASAARSRARRDCRRRRRRRRAAARSRARPACRRASRRS